MPSSPTPFRGLSPFQEDDSRFFFGREAEQEIVVNNLLASPLTVLYGATGVGKTSLLKAAVVHELRQRGLSNRARYGVPEVAVAYATDWRDDPVATVRRAIQQAVEVVLPQAAADHAPEPLPLAVHFWAERVQGPILIVLDHFEEYFLYRPPTRDRDPTLWLAQLIDDPDVEANCLVCVRDDALASLDVFRPLIPNLFQNSIRLHHLDRQAAGRVIAGPVESYNRLVAGDGAIMIEDSLVEAVLDSVRAGRPGDAEFETGVDAARLQLVMFRLWEVEQQLGSRQLRLDTLERLGGGQRILATHVDAALSSLPGPQQAVAAEVFEYLVTPSGSKIAHTVADLAGYVRRPAADLVPVLKELARLRVLRQRPIRVGDDLAYEIVHDTLVPAVLDWRTRYVQV